MGSGQKKAAQRQAQLMEEEARQQKAQQLQMAQANVSQMQQESAQRVANEQAAELTKVASEGVQDTPDVTVGDSSQNEDIESSRARRKKFFTQTAGANL